MCPLCMMPWFGFKKMRFYACKIKWNKICSNWPRYPIMWQVYIMPPLQCRHNERDGVSNHQPHDCLLNRLFGCRSKKASKSRVTGLWEGNSPVTGEFPVQRASIAEMFPFDNVIMTIFFIVWKMQTLHCQYLSTSWILPLSVNALEKG